MVVEWWFNSGYPGMEPHHPNNSCSTFPQTEDVFIEISFNSFYKCIKHTSATIKNQTNFPSVFNLSVFTDKRFLWLNLHLSKIPPGKNNRCTTNERLDFSSLRGLNVFHIVGLWMDAGNAVTSLCFPNFQNEVLAAVDAGAVDFSTVPTMLRFPRTGREASLLSWWTQCVRLASTQTLWKCVFLTGNHVIFFLGTGCYTNPCPFFPILSNYIFCQVKTNMQMRTMTSDVLAKWMKWFRNVVSKKIQANLKVKRWRSK